MILGQDSAIDGFLKAWRAGTPHHAWLLSGPKGVGKASFAKLAAARVLAEAAGPAPGGEGLAIDPNHQTAKLLAAGSHPDFRLLERVMNKSGTSLNRNINVEQVRSLAHFLTITPSMSPWRVIIIDAADDLEKSGANALLKMLEEPPAHTLFFLVAHAPGRLLPTIRSRCRRLEFQALDDDVMAAALAANLPDKGVDERARLVSLAKGSVGRAVALAELDLATLADEARGLMRDGDPTNARRAKLASALATKANADRYAAFLELVPGIVAEEARGADGMRRERALEAYAAVREEVALAPRLSLDAGAVVFRVGGLLAAVAAA